MLKIRIIALGKLKEKHFSQGASEYIKRLSRYCSLELCELPDLSVPDNPTEGEIQKVLQSESEAILKKLEGFKNIVALCVEGSQKTSEEFSEILSDAEMNGGSIAFIIGSSHGIHKSIKDLANVKLSFSKMTFPHQLARIMLLEQLYRGFKIKNNENYHK